MKKKVVFSTLRKKNMKKIILFISIATTLLFTACNNKKGIDTYKISKIIEEDNLRFFKKTIAKINLDTCNFENGRTALHYALDMNASKITNHLIDTNFKIHQEDSLGVTPFLLSIIKDKKEIIDKILEKGVTINKIDSANGLSALHYAVYNDNIDLVKKLLSKKADINLKSKSIMKDTPLHFAIEGDKDAIVTLLLAHKAIDTIKNVNNDTAIDLATKSKNPTILKLFYNKMDLDAKKTLFINTVRNSGDKDFLKEMLEEKWISKKDINDAFVFSKDTITSKILLKKGARIKALHSKYDYGAIHYGAIRGDTIMLGFLLKKGAQINQLAKNKKVSPLLYAAQLNGALADLNKNTQKLNMNINSIFYDMLGKSNDKNAQNSMEAVKFLLKNKAALNFKNTDNENALYYASSSFNHDVITYLKELGIKETKVFRESTSDRIRRASRNY